MRLRDGSCGCGVREREQGRDPQLERHRAALQEEQRLGDEGLSFSCEVCLPVNRVRITNVYE